MTRVMARRRAVVRTAAWTVPAISVAVAAPSFATSCAPTYQTITKTFVYKDALSNNVTVEVTAQNVPMTAPAGAVLDPIVTSSVVTISAASADLLKSFLLGNPAEIGGTSVSTTTLSGAYSATATTNLTIARAAAPPSGQPLVTQAGGTGTASTIPSGTSPGVVTLTMGSPQSTLIGYNSSGGQTGTYNSTLNQINGNDYTLGTFNVVAC